LDLILTYHFSVKTSTNYFLQGIHAIIAETQEAGSVYDFLKGANMTKEIPVRLTTTVKGSG